MSIEETTILKVTKIATARWLLYFLSTAIALFHSPIPVFAENPGIEILSWHCAEEGSHIVVRGEIRNQSNTNQSPAVIAMFKSVDGVMVTHRTREPVLDPLPAGQLSSIELRARNQRNIASCELTVQDPTSGNIYASAKQELPYELPDGLGDAKKGNNLFNGKGACDACHGYLGQVDQILDSTVGQVAEMNPKRPNLRNPQRLKLTTDKQRFRAIKYGIPGTIMVPMPHISDDEIIDMLAYLRDLRQEPNAEQQMK
jgi:cytochrome c2